MPQMKTTDCLVNRFTQQIIRGAAAILFLLIFGQKGWSQTLLETGVQKSMPNEWIDKDTHHKVICLSRREGSNSSFYFHNNPFINQTHGEGDRMVFYGSDTKGGRQAFTVNLKTYAISQVTNVNGRIGSEIIGHKTNSIYY